MARKLFCEINPLTYKISETKNILIRRIEWLINKDKYATTYSKQKLPITIYKNKSLIRRKLGNVDMRLQDNKAVNLNIAAPKINGIIIRPQELLHT